MDKRYFKEANRWFIDNYKAASAKCAMYRAGFVVLSVLSLLMAVALILTLPLKSYVPLPILVDSENRVIKPINTKADKLPIIEPMVEHDVVGYILNRENYSPYQIEHQITKIVHSSSVEVLQDYEKLLNSDSSPIKLYGKEGRVETQINNVVFLESPSEHKAFEELSSQLVQVDFTKKTNLKGASKEEKLTALLTFDYLGIPDDEIKAWHNWNGFVVTSYQIRRRV